MSNAIEIASLGRLLETGLIKRVKRNDHLLSRFETARWIEPTGRKDEWRPRSGATTSLEARITQLAPNWRDDFVFLRSHDLDPLDPRSIESLAMLRKQNTAAGIINRRNWNAATGLGPKHTARAQPSTALTKDWVMRFRPNKELRGNFEGEVVDFWQLSLTFTECIIPERLWLGFNGFVGVLPSLIVTCENLGAYVDLAPHEQLMVVYAPGADIETAAELLKHLPNTEWIHFGDLDPDGLKIAESLAGEIGRPLKFFVPSFAEEYLPGRPVKRPWGEIPNLPVFRELKKSQRRLFQEVFMLDARISTEVAALLNKAMEKERL